MLLFTLLYAGQTLAAENPNETDIQERRPGYRKRLAVSLAKKYRLTWYFWSKMIIFLPESFY